MDKEDVAHIYNGILLSHKKEQNNAICLLFFAQPQWPFLFIKQCQEPLTSGPLPEALFPLRSV